MTYFDFGSQPRPIYVSVVRYIHILRKQKESMGGLRKWQLSYNQYFACLFDWTPSEKDV